MQQFRSYSVTSSASSWIALGDREAKGIRSLQVDYELELGRLQDRQIGRLIALEDAAGIDASLPI